MRHGNSREFALLEKRCEAQKVFRRLLRRNGTTITRREPASKMNWKIQA